MKSKGNSDLKENKENPFDPESSSENSKEYSSFEDDSDRNPSIDNALRHNMELMNKREEFLQHHTMQRILIYDCNAKNSQYLW